MEKKEFLTTCERLRDFHFPRWSELPEFELYMDQVIGFAENHLSILSPDGKSLITPSMINNYVKNGIISPPINKRYNREHLAYLLIICSTKSVLELSFVSDIVDEWLQEHDIESVLDNFAEFYEKTLFTAANKAITEQGDDEGQEHLGMIAMENAINASATRIVALNAYVALDLENSAKPMSPADPKKTDKADKRLEKAERKLERAERKAEKAERKLKKAERRVEKAKRTEPTSETENE